LLCKLEKVGLIDVTPAIDDTHDSDDFRISREVNPALPVEDHSQSIAPVIPRCAEKSGISHPSHLSQQSIHKPARRRGVVTCDIGVDVLEICLSSSRND
jgi:hypothetical protein